MALPASDNFNRTDGTLGANWTSIQGTLNVVSNACKSSSGDSASYWAADSFNANHWSECKITTSSDGGPAVRCTASGCYYLGGGSGANAVWKWTSPGTWLKLADLNFIFTATDVIRAEATGSSPTTIKVYKNGVQQGSDVTDSSSPFTTGSAGLYISGTTTVLDDFQADNVATIALQQEGYRWRADDGNETGATWLANQDTAIERAIDANTRLRVLVNATGDVAAAQYQLEWKLSTDSVWRKVQ